jgi:hypothetical protein
MNCSKITLTNNGLSAWNTSFEIISLLNQNYINELSLITLQNVNGISDLLFFANVKNIRDFVLTNTSVVDIKDLPKPNKIGTSQRSIAKASHSTAVVITPTPHGNTRI